MTTFTRIKVPLIDEELEALERLAVLERRRIESQGARLIREALVRRGFLPKMELGEDLGETPEEAKVERMTDALQRIERWGQAYPEEMFPKPDLEKARALLEAGGMTLGSVTGHCMRHVATRMAEIAREALG